MSPYANLRELYRPEQVRRLLVAESPPDPDGGPVRFFYYEDFEPPDTLYLALAQELFPDWTLRERQERKAEVLTELKRQGIWLIDATDTPINRRKHYEPERRRQLRSAYLTGVRALPQVIRGIGPSEVFFCTADLFDRLAGKEAQMGAAVFPGRVYFPTSRCRGPEGEPASAIFQAGLAAFLAGDRAWRSPVAR